MVAATPRWIEGLDAFQVPPPFYGLGAVSLHNRPVVAFDTETYAMPEDLFKTNGGKVKRYMRRKAPRAVVATFAGYGRNTPVPSSIAYAETQGHARVFRNGRAWSAIVDRTAMFDVFEALLQGNTLLVAHNVAFDLGVFAHGRPELLPLIFKAMQEGRITDTMIREMLLKIAFGEMQDEGAAGRGPSFSLAALEKEYGVADRSHLKAGSDIWRLRYHELDGVPLDQWPEAAIQYAIDDATNALSILLLQAPVGKERLSEQMLPMTTNSGGIINEIQQVRAVWSLHLMGMWGLRVDPVLHAEWGEEITETIDRARAIGRKAGFIRANGKLNTRALQELVKRDFEQRGKEYPLTPKGGEIEGETGERPEDLKYVSTSKDTLIQCVLLKMDYTDVDGVTGKVAPVKVWGESAFMLRMQSTYYTPASMGTAYSMLYDFNVLVATGRTSARNPNMQNPPRKGSFRELFVARPGMVLSSVDYASEELRTLAQLHFWWFGKSALREAFLRGEDPHAMFGAMLAGVEYEEFKTWKRSPDAALRKRFKDLRQAAKAANFGYPGGLGAEKFVKYAWDTYRVDLAVVATLTGFAVTLPEEETPERHNLAIRYAKSLKRQWLAQWEEAKKYMALIGDEVRVSDTFTYLQPVSWRQRGGCFYTSGNNTGFQGLAADAAKDAMWRLAILAYLPKEYAVPLLEMMDWVPDPRTGKTPGKADFERWSDALFGTRPVLFVHDEILVEGPEETAHIWAPAQAEVMAAAAQIYTPDVPQDAEEAIMRRWYKGAELVHELDGDLYEGAIAGGRLVPWEPGQTYKEKP